MSTRDNNLASFEKFLFEAIQNPAKKNPLCTEDVFQILSNYDFNEDDKDLQDENIVFKMKEAFEHKQEIENKLQNMNLIRSFGELVRIFIEVKSLSIEKVAQALALSTECFEKYLNDKSSLIEFGKQRFLNIASLFDISIDNLLVIIEKTFNLQNIRKENNLTAICARADKKLNESSRQKTTLNAMEELLLKISKDDKTQATPFDELKQEIIEATKIEQSPFDNIVTCFTLNRSSATLKLLNQLEQKVNNGY